MKKRSGYPTVRAYSCHMAKNRTLAFSTSKRAHIQSYPSIFHKGYGLLIQPFRLMKRWLHSYGLTLVVWRRLGKEHGEGAEFRLNAPDVVAAHIQNKIEAYRQTPLDDWRWWQLSNEIIVETPLANAGFNSGAIFRRHRQAGLEHVASSPCTQLHQHQMICYYFDDMRFLW